MPALEFGLLLPTRELYLDRRPDPSPLLDLAQRAEAAGLASVWVGDGVTNRPRHEPLTLLAALAARTRRVRLGTAVLLAPLRTPVLLAHELTTLDWLAEGRLVLGLGSGYPTSQAALQSVHLGTDHASRRRRLHETIAFLRAWWSTPPGETVSINGETVTLSEVPVSVPPYTPGGPPVWLPGSGPQELRQVAVAADGWIPYPPRPEDYARRLAELTVAAAAAHRPTPTPAIYLTLAMDRDRTQARRLLERSVERYYGLPAAAVGTVQALLSGTPEEVAARVGEYVVAGARHVVVRFAGLDPRVGLDLLTGYVIPHCTEIVEEK